MTTLLTYEERVEEAVKALTVLIEKNTEAASILKAHQEHLAEVAETILTAAQVKELEEHLDIWHNRWQTESEAVRTEREEKRSYERSLNEARGQVRLYEQLLRKLADIPE